jgi:hypothetical protein
VVTAAEAVSEGEAVTRWLVCEQRSEAEVKRGSGARSEVEQK